MSLKKINNRVLNGWSPEIPDVRDFKFSSMIPVSTTPIKIPNSVDLRGKCSTVEDQGQIGSCVGNSCVSALEYLKNFNKKQFVDFSRLFVYYNARLIEGTTNYDCGCYIRNAIKALSKHGVCPESIWPYDITKYATKPSNSSYVSAISNKIGTYYRLETLDDIITCLASRYPVIFGMACYDYFLSEEMSKTGKLNLPKAGERMRGGHAILATGYDLKKKTILVRNSWGMSWGIKGYFTMPMEYISNKSLCDDMWTIRK